MDQEQLAAEPKAPAADIEKVRAEARRQGYAEAREIVELCALAGMPGRAAALLAKDATPAEARQQLMEARAAEDAAEIRSHVMPDTGTAPKARRRKQSGDEGRRAAGRKRSELRCPFKRKASTWATG